MSVKRGVPAPAVVGSHFVKQYYGEVLSKKPVELHRFYKDESTFCHASGTKEEEPVSGLADIKAKIEHLGLGGATVDLGCGSVDAQPSEGDGVLLMVTGSITITDGEARQFVQTFFLARQYQDNDRHNYFVRNDIFRFLDVLPEVVQGAIRKRDAESTTIPISAPAVKEGLVEAVEEEASERPHEPASTAKAVMPTQAVSRAGSPMPTSVPATSFVGAAPPTIGPQGEASDGSAPTPAAVVSPPSAPTGTPPSSPSAGVAADAELPTSCPTPPAGTTTTAAPIPAIAPGIGAPSVPVSYASVAKSWATVAAVGGETSTNSLGAGGGGGGGPSSSGSCPGVAGGIGRNGAPADTAIGGAWEIVSTGDSPSVGGEAMVSSSHGGQRGNEGGGGGASSSRLSNKGFKGQYSSIPLHASPAVAASAAASREAAAAGDGEIVPATSIFVRKVDTTVEKEDMIAHFGAYGKVTGISMNPTRGYAFIDYPSNDCVVLALSTKEHYVKQKLLVVEERHSPMTGRNLRGEHGGSRGRNGGRGRGSSGRDVGRDGERGDRRSQGGRSGRGGVGRGDRPDGSGSKDMGHKARSRVEQA